MTHLRRADVLALAAILLAILAYFAPVWATGRTFVSDGQRAAFFAPTALWSDAWIGGWPAGADPACYVFYPIRLLLRATGSFNLFVMSAYAIAAASLYAYLRIVGTAAPAALLGGLALAFSGFMVSHVAHTSMLHTAAWLTLALAGVEATLVDRRRRWALCAGFAVAIACTAGHPQILAYGLVALALYLAWRLRSELLAKNARAWALATAALPLGVALASPVLFLTRAYLHTTPRETMSFETYVTHALSVSELPSFFLPFLFGGGVPPYASEHFGRWAANDVSIHLPFVVILFAAVGVPGARRRSLALYWVAIAILALLLALGDDIPVLATAVYHLPVLSLFRAPSRHAFELSVALCILAALGFDAWLRWDISKPTWRASLAIVFAAFGFTVYWVAHQHRAIAALARLRRHQLPPWHENPAVAVPIALAMLTLFVVFTSGQLSRRLKIVVTLSAFVIQATAFGWFLPWPQSSPIQADLRPTALEAVVAREFSASGGRVLNVQGRLGTILEPERSRLFGLPSANWYGPLVPERAAALLEISPAGRVTNPLHSTNVALDVYGVRYVAATDRGGPVLSDQLRWRTLGTENGATVYENLRAQPLAWLVGRWQTMPDDLAVEKLHGVRDDPSSTFLVRDQAIVADGSSDEIASFDAGSVLSRWHAPTVVEITTSSRSGGLLVVGVNHAPEWQATVDGVPTAVQRANYSLMGVTVPAGEHDVRLRYVSGVWQLGVVVGLGALAVFAVVCAFAPSRHAPSASRSASRQPSNATAPPGG